MKNLIIKDLRLLRVNIILSIILGLIFAYIGATNTQGYVSQLIYTYVIIFLIYLGIIFLSQKEAKTKSDIVFNSMPVKRDEIVKSKYITILLYLLLVSGIIYIGSNIFAIFTNSTLGKGAGIMDILLVLGLCIFLISIYLPFEYYNIGKVQIFNSILYMLIILLPNIINKYRNKIVNSNTFRTLMKLDFNSITIILLGVSIIFYIISLYISKTIYERKEF